MRRFGLLGFMALLLLVGAAAAVTYNLGVSAGAAEAALAEGAAVIYAPAAGFSPFGLILGLFFVVLLIGFVAKAFAGPRMAMGHGRGPWGYGPGPWGYGRSGRHGDLDQQDVPEHFRPMLARWHRDAHAAPPSNGPEQTAAPHGADQAAPPPPTEAGTVHDASRPAVPGPDDPVAR